MFLATQLFAITQRLFAEFNDFPVLFQLIHCHEIIVLNNLKIKTTTFGHCNAKLPIYVFIFCNVIFSLNDSSSRNHYCSADMSPIKIVTNVSNVTCVTHTGQTSRNHHSLTTMGHGLFISTLKGRDYLTLGLGHKLIDVSKFVSSSAKTFLF